MKKILIGIMTLTSMSAFARTESCCQLSKHLEICVGDKVYMEKRLGNNISALEGKLTKILKCTSSEFNFWDSYGSQYEISTNEGLITKTDQGKLSYVASGKGCQTYYSTEYDINRTICVGDVITKETYCGRTPRNLGDQLKILGFFGGGIITENQTTGSAPTGSTVGCVLHL